MSASEETQGIHSAQDITASSLNEPNAASLARQRYAWLTGELSRHNQLYHEQDAPEIADDEYDALAREARALEAAHPDWAAALSDSALADSGLADSGLAASPAQAVGGAPSTAFLPVNHPTPMTSLDNVFDDDELRGFQDKLARALNISPEAADFTYTCELKIDGLSVNMYYLDGELQWAATRGNGLTGEIVTAQALTIAGLPQTLDGVTGELRCAARLPQPRGIRRLQCPRQGTRNAAAQKPAQRSRRSAAPERPGTDPLAQPRGHSL